MNKILSKIYYDTKNCGSYSGIQRLYTAAKKKIPNLKIIDVKNFLKGELTYTLHKPLRKKFKRNRILVSRINEQFEADLVDMREFSSQNNGITYILTVIDCFSKYAFVKAIKNKTGQNIIKAFKEIFKERKPSKLRTDNGKEFVNKEFQDFLKQESVLHFTSNEQIIKCAIVERFNRTLRSKMFKYFRSKGTRKYIDVLQDFVYSYNRAKHRSIKMSPIEVTKQNEKQVFRNLYGYDSLTKLLRNKKKLKTDIKEGDTVRRAYDLKAFDRGYYPNWSDEVFTVQKTIKGDKQIVFKIKDYSGNIVEQKFYPEQIQKITENLHRVEKVLKTRVYRRQKQVFVKWLNYPESYNSWLPAKDIKDVRK